MESKQYLEVIRLIYGKNIQAFNLEGTRINKARLSKWDTEFDERVPEIMHWMLPDDLKTCLKAYATADQAAIKFQSHLGRTVSRLLVLIVLAVAVFGAYAHLFDEHHQAVVLFCYLSLLICADLLFIRSTKSDALIEAFRETWEALVPCSQKPPGRASRKSPCTIKPPRP